MAKKPLPVMAFRVRTANPQCGRAEQEKTARQTATFHAENNRMNGHRKVVIDLGDKEIAAIVAEELKAEAVIDLEQFDTDRLDRECEYIFLGTKQELVKLFDSGQLPRDGRARKVLLAQ